MQGQHKDPNYSHNYYIRNRPRILDRVKQRAIENFEHIKQYKKDYGKINQPKTNRLNRLIRFRNKIQLMELLGGIKCKECGFDNIKALQFAHINDDGNIDRRRFKTLDQQTYYYLHNIEEAQEKLEVLCANCNVIHEADRRIKGVKNG